MPADRELSLDPLDDDKPRRWYSDIFAEDEDLDRRAMWRLGSWGTAALGALVAAIMAAQSSITFRRDQVASAELSRQAQQLQRVAKEGQIENRRLASAVDTLNADRDRLYSRLTSLEQNLDSVTGSIARQDTALPKIPSSAPAAAEPDGSSPANNPQPKLSQPATVEAQKPAADLTPSVVASAPAIDPGSEKPVTRTEFGIDIGSANSVEGLRALWKGLARSKALEGLQPLIVVQERSGGLGMQLRLVAGPFSDAAGAAKACATLADAGRACETSVYNGQRLAMQASPKPISAPPATLKKRIPRSEMPQPARSSGFPPLFGTR